MYILVLSLCFSVSRLTKTDGARETKVWELHLHLESTGVCTLYAVHTFAQTCSVFSCVWIYTVSEKKPDPCYLLQ